MVRARLPRRGKSRIRGKKPDLIIIDDVASTNSALTEIVAYAAGLGEPIHPFVQDVIKAALIRASR